MTVAVDDPTTANTLSRGVLDGSHSNQEITDLETLHEATSCGITVQQVKDHITAVSVANQGSGLAFWPPALSQFTAVKSINLSGNAITFIPQSIQTLTGLKVLSVARNSLTALPPELSCLTNLTELDVGRNQLGALPAALCSLGQLQVLNIWGNQLQQLPCEFGNLAGLTRLGLKGNQLEELPSSFSRLVNLVELFLTDNKLTTLPQGFGQLRSLVKLQASFNPFTALPDDLWQLPELELFRLAVGQLQEWPQGLAESGGLPKLAWCSIGRNPAAAAVPAIPEHLPRVERQHLIIGEKLGQGASGEVFSGVYEGREVAIKIFLAEVSPDGSTAEEMAINCAVEHPNLTKVLALVVDTADESGAGSSSAAGAAAAGSAAAAAAAGGCGDVSSADGVVGLVLELVRGKPLAGRPTSEHLLRCKWADDEVFPLSTTLSVCHGVASALAYLHRLGIAHGDVYAHNIMIDDRCRAVICDFGASYCYHPKKSGRFWQAMEVRAFGLFMHDMVSRTPAASGSSSSSSSTSDEPVQQLQLLVQKCLAAAAMERPLFKDIEGQLLALMQQLGVAVPGHAS